MIISPGCENSPQKKPFLDSPKKGGVGWVLFFPLSMRRRQHWRSRKRPVAQAVRPSVSPVRREGRREAAPAARIWASREHRRSRSGIQTPERAPWEQTIMESGQKQRHATCKYVSIVATRTWSVDQWCHRPRAGGREGGTSIRAHANYSQVPGIAESCHTSCFGSQPCVCKSNHNSLMLPQHQLLLLLRCCIPFWWVVVH